MFDGIKQKFVYKTSAMNTIIKALLVLKDS